MPAAGVDTPPGLPADTAWRPASLPRPLVAAGELHPQPSGTIRRAVETLRSLPAAVAAAAC